MRIAFLGIKRVPGVMGADRVVELVLSALPSGHEYTVYVKRERGWRAPELDKRVRYVRLPALKGKHLGPASYFALAGLHAAFVGRYDVVHVHNSDFGVFALPLRLRRHVRVVATFHGDPYERAKWGPIARVLLRFSELCLVRTAHVLTSVTPVKRVPGRVVRHIPNGVERWVPRADDYSAGAVLRSLALAEREYVLFACGRLDPTKGLHHVIEAYSMLRDAPPLVAVGDFSHEPVYSNRMRDAAVKDSRIRLVTDLLERDTLLSLVNRARVFVFPSEVEGMALMLLEALGAGAKVICSDIPENLAVVGSSYPLAFRAGDANALATALKDALHAEYGLDAVKNARTRALERFRWEAAAAAYLKCYDGTCAEGDTPGDHRGFPSSRCTRVVGR